MAEILELKNISKYYGSFAANRDISLKIKKGTVHAVVGENGAGKSTLMNIIAGVNQPTSGEIFLNGKKVSFQDANDANRAGIGMVQQEFMLFDKLSVLDNIIMGYEDTRKGLFINKKESADKVKNICEEYGFHFDLHTLVRDLPVAVQQQVEIVKVLFRKADIIILDEPTAVLPYQEIQGLFKAIRYLISQGKTVIFITHKLKEVLEISDTITVMKSGVISGEISASEATELTLTNMMVGRDVVLKLDKKAGHSERKVLSVDHLVVKDDRKITRVKDVSFCLKEGEILGLVGVSGNGQNELVEAITGMRNYESGCIRLHEEQLPAGSPRNNRLNHIGYVPQDRISEGINREASLWENAIMGYHIVKGFGNRFILKRKQAISFTERIIHEFNVKASSPNLKIQTLSGGNIQKLIVGREFLQDNSLLIIEDPTRGIDIGAIEFIWKKIESLAAAGTAILLVSHELNEVMEVSDRILVMYGGQLYDGGLHGEKTETDIGLLMTGGGCP